MTKHKHLTLEDRFAIRDGLKQRFSFKKIAETIGKDCTTVSKEIRNHLVYKQTGSYGRPYNPCAKKLYCDLRLICNTCTAKRTPSFCQYCSKCHKNCKYFEHHVCPQLIRPPYVCNGCPARDRCREEKRFYEPTQAHEEYTLVKSESREGISLSEEEVNNINKIVSPRIFKGQSIRHIHENHQDSLMVSQSTLYRLVDYNCLDAINLDLKRKVRYKPRRKKKQFKVDKACKIGRSHKDYLAFRMEHPELRVVHLDTVEGKKGGKVLLTVFFEGFSMMLAYLRESNDSQSVINIIDRLYIELSPSLFTEIMPILLCDNGSEFSNPTALEFDGQGNRRTHVFYCDSQAPHQRPDSERNHSFIRDFSPKGKSMDHLSQSDVQLMMDNINSYSRGTIAREICDVKSAYDMFSFYYGENILNVLGCKRIPSDNVTLNSSIWKNQNNVEQNLFLDSEPEVTT